MGDGLKQEVAEPGEQDVMRVDSPYDNHARLHDCGRIALTMVRMTRNSKSGADFAMFPKVASCIIVGMLIVASSCVHPHFGGRAVRPMTLDLDRVSAFDLIKVCLTLAYGDSYEGAILTRDSLSEDVLRKIRMSGVYEDIPCEEILKSALATVGLEVETRPYGTLGPVRVTRRVNRGNP